MSFPRYPEYKDSGVEWLGEVPTHWQIHPISTVAEIVNGHPFDSALFSSNEGHPLVRIRDLNSTETEARYTGPFEPRVGITSADILIGMDGDFQVGRWRGAGQALLNQRMCCVKAHGSATGRIIEYALPFPLKIINDVTYATTVKHLSSAQIEKTRIALPPTQEEQTVIAAFLDRECSKIDALVAEQEKLIALLKEKRQAVISHAVTKGLNPDAPMKPSGIEWLGDVPAHWVVMPIRLAAKLESGHTPSRNHPEYWENCDVPWFTLADVWQIREQAAEYVYDTKEKVSELGLANSSARLLPKGTVILSRTASVGFSAIMGVDMATTQDFANWICGPKLYPDYLLFVFRSMTGEFRRLMMGSTHNTIYMPDIQSFRFVLPPKKEQQAIVDHVRRTAKQFNELIAQAERASILLKERRSALISAAVTGQIDLRGTIQAEAK